MSKALAPIDEVRQQLTAMVPQFKMALPAHITPEKFMRVVLTSLQNSPDLLQCDRRSLYGAAMKACQDGLLPDGRESALVKFGDKVQYMPMIGGILKKVRNSGELASITSQVVHEHDKFRYWVDADGEHIEHEPNLFSDRGRMIGVYALAKMKDGAVFVEVMTMADVDAIKSVARSKGGPWSGPFASEMIKKSSLRRLAKRLPMSTDLDQVITRDDEMYDFSQSQPQPQQESEVEKPKSSRSKIKDAIVTDQTEVKEEITVSEAEDIPL